MSNRNARRRGSREPAAAPARARILATMLGFASCATSAGAGSPGAPLGPAQAEADAELAVRAAVLAISDHAARRDLDLLRSDHLADARFTKFGPRVAERQGFEEAMADEHAAFSAVRELSIEFRDLKVDVFGDLAVTTSYPVFRFVDRGGEARVREARMTLVYVRTPDGWKIAHEHSSPLGE